MKGQQAVIGNDIPTKDSVIAFRFKLGGAQSVTANKDGNAKPPTGFAFIGSVVQNRDGCSDSSSKVYITADWI